MNAEHIVDLIIEDIIGRSGLGNEWEAIDEEIQEEIRQSWIEIVEQGTDNG